MNTTQRIIKNTMSLFASGLLAPLIALVVVVYLARVLGPGDFGAVNFAIALVAYFTLFTDMGLSYYGARETARDREGIRIFMGSVLSLRIFLAVVSFVMLLLFVRFLDKPFEIKLLIIFFGIGLLPSAFLVEWAYQGMERMEFIGLSRILTRAIYIVLVMMFVRRHDQLYLVPCFYVSGVVIINATFFYIFTRKYGFPKINFDTQVWRKMLKASLPIGISVILVQVIYNIDTVMLGFMKGEEDVGYYSAAYKLIFPSVLAIGAYFDAIYPVTSKYFKTSLEKLKMIQDHSARLMITLALPCAVGGVVMAPSVIGLFYGPQYSRSAIVFQIMIVMVAIICLNTLYARGLWSCNKQGAYLKIVAGQASACVLLNLILIPRMGIVGAAVSKLIAEMVGLVFYWREFNKVVKVGFALHMGRPLLAVVAMGVFLVVVRHLHMLILIVGGVLIYGVFMYLTKGLTKDDIMMLKRAIT